MFRMTDQDDGMHSEMSFGETSVGKLQVRTMAYHSGTITDTDAVVFVREIQIHAGGDLIFQGTLADLIKLLGDIRFISHGD